MEQLPDVILPFLTDVFNIIFASLDLWQECT